MSQQALVVIDIQHGFFNESPAILDGDGLIANVSDLIKRARASGIPVVFIQHVRPGQDANDTDLTIHPALGIQEHDTLVVKSSPDSFFGTSLEKELGRLGAHELVITGLQTEYCVDTTCRRANSMGYDVVLVGDAHSTWDRDDLSAQQIINHHNSVLGDWFVDVMPTSEIAFGDSQS